MSEENQKFKVKIWSHRGANEYAPENTMEAFEKAVELGADGVELDVHQTADNEIVVIHDERLDRTSNGRGFVKNYTLNELRKFDYARDSKFKGQKHYEIPLLKEVFELLKPTDLSINMESSSICGRLTPRSRCGLAMRRVFMRSLPIIRTKPEKCSGRLNQVLLLSQDCGL